VSRSPYNGSSVHSSRPARSYSTVVLLTGRFSPVAGAVALALLMLPTITLTTEESIRSVGEETREAAIGMDATQGEAIGMVFQKPNPFAMTVYRNVAYGLKLNGYKGNRDEMAEQALRGAALGDEVKDELHESALELSGGQQQRSCIARSIATEPDVLLMDEPCSAIDPLATRKIEELMQELKGKYTIAIVTHNLRQAKRVADKTAFLYVDSERQGDRTGYLVEYGDTQSLFEYPKEKRTQAHIQGEFS